jgi:flagellar hook-length control protein FliK
MVVHNNEAKASSSLIDLLGSNAKTKNSKTNDAFSQLLASLNAPIKETKEFSVVVDPKNIKTTTKEPLNTGAKVAQLLISDDEIKALPKELVDALSNDQIKNLIGRAREYLKNSIESKAPEYKLEGKEMPKTLLGLVELADKIGIDLSEITLSTLDDAQKPLFKNLPTALAQKSVIELKEPQAPKEIKAKESLAALLNDTAIALGELTPRKEGEKAASPQPLQSLLKGVDTVTLVEVPKEGVLKEPLKAALPSSIEALSALLKGDVEGEKGEKSEKIKGVDEAAKGLHTNKADSLEVKTKEAAQGMRAFAIDLKEAAESYKPPFTRITMKLNPERLGEVEVTLVQRGNNVHVNIQSNNAASVAFLAHNAQELKAQLAHQGIAGATMSFMSGGDGQPHNPQQQHNRFAAYESLQELESAQKELSALEIILPHYA